MTAHTPDKQFGANGRVFVAYLVGYLLSAALMFLAYHFVQSHTMSPAALRAAVVIIAVALLLIQVIFFLRLNSNTVSGRWNLMCFIFTMLIIAIVVIGSLWIMYNLNYYMVH